MPFCWLVGLEDEGEDVRRTRVDWVDELMGDKVERMVKGTQDEWPPSILDIQRGIYRF